MKFDQSFPQDLTLASISFLESSQFLKTQAWQYGQLWVLGCTDSQGTGKVFFVRTSLQTATNARVNNEGDRLSHRVYISKQTQSRLQQNRKTGCFNGQLAANLISFLNEGPLTWQNIRGSVFTGGFRGILDQLINHIFVQILHYKRNTKHGTQNDQYPQLLQATRFQSSLFPTSIVSLPLQQHRYQ